MKRILAALLALALACAPAWAATLLPPGLSQFLDGNGKPLAGGSVAFYVPNTTTPKSTWKDKGQSALNTNPLVLDAAGRAVIYGNGSYRQIIKDKSGNLIFDGLTADTSSAQISWGGTSGGTANQQTVSVPNFTSADGQIVGFIAGFTNTDQLAILPNGNGAIAVRRDTLAGPANLTGSEVVAGSAVLLIYDAQLGAFHLIGGQPSNPGFGALQSLSASSTVDLGLAASSHAVLLGGSGTVASFGNSANVAAPVYFLRFGGAMTLSQGASIDTPTGADLNVQAGDTAVALYLGGGAWRIAFYQPVTGGVMPAGMLATFGMSVCPNGWLEASGGNYSRAAYPGLYATIGTIWGAGNGSTTAGLPDMRGKFARAWDHGRGVDSGRGIGTDQADALASHSHVIPYVRSTGNVYVTSASSGTTNAVQYVGEQTPNSQGASSATGASETRPVNVSVLYCIKY